MRVSYVNGYALALQKLASLLKVFSPWQQKHDGGPRVGCDAGPPFTLPQKREEAQLPQRSPCINFPNRLSFVHVIPVSTEPMLDASKGEGFLVQVLVNTGGTSFTAKAALHYTAKGHSAR